MKKGYTLILLLFTLIVFFASGSHAQEPSGSCISQWNCTDYSICFDGLEERKCIDQNLCEGTTPPQANRPCIALNPLSSDCKPNWQCTGFTLCNENNEQTRLCLDLNKCPTQEEKPAESTSCAPAELNHVSIVLLLVFLLLILGILLSLAY